MRSRTRSQALRMQRRTVSALRQPLADLIGRPVMTEEGTSLGVVVGRVTCASSIDLLVRRRRLFHKSMYLRLSGDAISVDGHTFVHHPPTTHQRSMPAVIHLITPGHRARGGAA
jgi:hypothetical protein